MPNNQKGNGGGDRDGGVPRAAEQPDLDELDAPADDVSLNLGTDSQEAGMLFLRAETHHALYPCTAVPTAVENDDFPCRGEVLHVTLHVHL